MSYAHLSVNNFCVISIGLYFLVTFYILLFPIIRSSIGKVHINTKITEEEKNYKDISHILSLEQELNAYFYAMITVELI